MLLSDVPQPSTRSSYQLRGGSFPDMGIKDGIIQSDAFTPSIAIQSRAHGWMITTWPTRSYLVTTLNAAGSRGTNFVSSELLIFWSRIPYVCHMCRSRRNHAWIVLESSDIACHELIFRLRFSYSSAWFLINRGTQALPVGRGGRSSSWVASSLLAIRRTSISCSRNLRRSTSSIRSIK